LFLRYKFEMASLNSVLPPVAGHVWDRDSENRKRALQRQDTQVVSTARVAPPYGQRKGWTPRTEEDYGDGGAYPECPVAQYPLGMGRRGGKGTGNALAVTLDAQGEVRYDAIARQGQHKDKIVYSKLTDMLPSAIADLDDPSLQKPSEEELASITEKTRLALERLTNNKIAAAQPVRCADKQAPAQYIRYTPGTQGSQFNSGAQQRVIRMVETQKDPMEPPKFSISKKIPRGPPSPPATVLHSPTRKVTVKEQQEWRIPPSVSNWKNPKGFTLPLDKRLAADGRGLQSQHVNEKFAKMAEALDIAARKAREQVDMRSQLEKMNAQKEKVRKEESLKNLAKKAREEQHGIRQPTGPVDSEEAQRDQLRAERARERKRENAINERRAGANRERDITEQIALGLPQKTTSGGEAQFDQRLFNQSRGMDSGFGDEEGYNVYDKPWRSAAAVGNALYKPSSGAKEYDLEDAMNQRRFVPDRGFSGSGEGGERGNAPVQFEKQADGEFDDMFGIIGLLDDAKKGSKRGPDEDRGGDGRKRRRN